MTPALGADLLDSASLGEVAWLDAAGRPRAAGVLPLLDGGHPVLALTLDRSALAAELAAAEVVDLLVREPRNTSTGWRPAAWRCHSRLLEDLEGDAWMDRLRLQELRRYPPARRYADSLLLCREHSWFLPRLLVVLEPVAALDAPGVRDTAVDLLLVTAHHGLPEVCGVVADDATVTRSWGSAPEPGPGLVLGQDALFPDLEVWEWWTRAVDVGDRAVAATEPLPRLAPPRIPGLRARWRRERDYAAACRRGRDAWSR